MPYNRFGLKVILLSGLITATAFVLAWSFHRDYLTIARFTFAALLLAEVFALVHYVSKTNRSLNQFLHSLRYLDNIKESDTDAGSFQELNLSYNRIIDIVRQTHMDKEAEHKYLEHIIEHIGSGLISFSPNGRVEFINQAAKDIFEISDLKRISALDKKVDGLSQTLITMKPFGKELIKVNSGNKTLRLSTKATTFRLYDRSIRLVSFQNISAELEAEEASAWQKLIRVLTHEIMNSVTPIKSLTGTIIKMLQNNTQKESVPQENEIISNALDGLQAIDKRSKGLLNFVKSYRNLTRIPKPVFTSVPVEDLLKNAVLLMTSEIPTEKISIRMELPSSELRVTADEKMITQILINLVKNAYQALKDKEGGEIVLGAGSDENGGVYLQITDNGHGIQAENLEKVFVPFYTTKAEGTGIGLSLSRQIMIMHGGSIEVRSIPDVETQFTLYFQ